MQTPNDHITGWKQASLRFLNMRFLKTGSVCLDDYDVKQRLILYVLMVIIAGGGTFMLGWT